MIADITAVALMLGAIGAAAAAVALLVRLLLRAPRVLDHWLDGRAAARVRQQAEERALACLIEMTPALRIAVEQLQPNNGESLYDMAHQLDASMNEIKAWVQAHTRQHEREGQ